MNSRLAATLLALALVIVAAVVFALRYNPPHNADRIAVSYESAAPSPARAPVRTAAASARPVLAPSATTMPTPTVAPSATTTAPMASVTPVVLPPVPRLSPDRAPRIVAVNISSQAVHPGDVVSGVVETTSNVASVEAHLATYAIPMQKIGVGKFTLKYQVPDIPFFFRGKTYAIDIVAHNTRGDTVSTSIPITVR